MPSPFLKATVLKGFFLVVLPLILLLPIWIVFEPLPEVEAVIVFFMLAPFVIYPIIWSVGTLTGSFTVDTYFSYNEVLGMFVFSGLLMPLVILMAIFFSVALRPLPSDMTLGFMIALPTVWLPLVGGSFFSPTIQNAIIESGAAAASSDSMDMLVNRRELRFDTLALFCFFSIPLGLFVPLYIGVDHTTEGETAMIFFLLTSNIVAFQSRLAARCAMLFASWFRPLPGKIWASVDTAEAIVKLVYGCSVLPMMILLPLYLHASLTTDARRMLGFFMLGLPPTYLLEVLRVAHRRNRGPLPVKIAIAFFFVVAPLGVLLPSWLAGEPDATGKSIFLAFMMAPSVICFLISIVFTIAFEARLPFYPLDLLIKHSFITDVVYSVVVPVIPTVILLPVFFECGLEDTPSLVVLCFLGMFSGLLAMLLIVSCIRKNSHSFESEDNVQDLPYASAVDVLGKAAVDSKIQTDLLNTGRKQMVHQGWMGISPNENGSTTTMGGYQNMEPDQRSSAYATVRPSSSSTGYATIQPVDGAAIDPTSGYASVPPVVPGYATVHPYQRPTYATVNPNHWGEKNAAGSPVRIAWEAKPLGTLDDSFDMGLDVGIETDKRPLYAGPEIWGGWKPGMRCKAPYEFDEHLYEAKILRIDYPKGIAVIHYDGYDKNENTTVNIAELYQDDDPETKRKSVAAFAKLNVNTNNNNNNNNNTNHASYNDNDYDDDVDDDDDDDEDEDAHNMLSI